MPRRSRKFVTNFFVGHEIIFNSSRERARSVYAFRRYPPRSDVTQSSAVVSLHPCGPPPLPRVSGRAERRLRSGRRMQVESGAVECAERNRAEWQLPPHNRSLKLGTSRRRRLGRRPATSGAEGPGQDWIALVFFSLPVSKLKDHRH